MIRIKSLQIKEFRGVRDLTLDLADKNYGICGPNGTGKSGVVDAVEFCLTGNVTRLSGEGTGEISVREHAPHVDQKDHPENSEVTLIAHVPKLGKSVTITRSVKTPKDFNITPSDPDLLAIVEELQTHPEFALSRREIVKYIITPPGQRSLDVQTLLRLDHLEKLRQSLTTFKNNCKRKADQDESTRRTAVEELQNALGIEELNDKLVLEKINEKRKSLGLEVLTELNERTSFKEGFDVTLDDNGPKYPTEPILKKKTALADLSVFHKEIAKDVPEELSIQTEAIQKALKKLQDDAMALTLARRHNFIKTGLEFVTEEACPLCDTPWAKDELRVHLEQKLLSSKEIGDLLETIDKHIVTIMASLSNRIQSVERVIGYCKKLDPAIDHADLERYLAELNAINAPFAEFQEDRALLEPAVEAADKTWWTPDRGAQTRSKECLTAVKDLPDVSAEEEARDDLVVAQDRYEKLLKTIRNAKRSKAEAVVGKNVLDHYGKTLTDILEEIYDNVAEDFSNYYRIINLNDEEQFVGKLKSAPAKLNFNVDFYGRGLFPPGAYHSEGHQDGMGLCLYLALMKHTLGGDFTFAVLDDVLMSVDTGHRREVCRLLKTEFPTTQFILTTHDRVWLQYMKTENLVGSSTSFGGWTVDSGPRVWDDHDIWTEIQSELDKEDVPKAAWLLRRFLEYTAGILADNMRASVEFRGDGRYDLGDLMPPTLKEWRKRLEQGEKSATNWNQTETVKKLKQKRSKAKVLVGTSSVEQWAINPSVHFNEWANLDSHEFAQVVAAFSELLENLRCQQEACKSYLYLSPNRGDPEALRCNCGSVNINLKLSNWPKS